MRLTVSVATRNAERKIERMNKEIKKIAKEGILGIGRYAVQYAKSIAPYDTGRTFRAISFKRGSNQYKATVIAKDGHGLERKGKDGKMKRFNLTYWLHFSPKAQAHLNNGTADFMFKTYKVVEKKFKVEMRKQFHQMEAKINLR